VIEMEACSSSACECLYEEVQQNRPISYSLYPTTLCFISDALAVIALLPRSQADTSLPVRVNWWRGVRAAISHARK